LRTALFRATTMQLVVFRLHLHMRRSLTNPLTGDDVFWGWETIDTGPADKLDGPHSYAGVEWLRPCTFPHPTTPYGAKAGRSQLNENA
jgi:hypothetical protein